MAAIEVSDDCDKNYLLLKALPFKNPQRNMLHERMDTDYNVWFVLH